MSACTEKSGAAIDCEQSAAPFDSSAVFVLSRADRGHTDTAACNIALRAAFALRSAEVQTQRHKNRSDGSCERTCSRTSRAAVREGCSSRLRAVWGSCSCAPGVLRCSVGAAHRAAFAVPFDNSCRRERAVCWSTPLRSTLSQHCATRRTPTRSRLWAARRPAMEHSTASPGRTSAAAAERSAVTAEHNAQCKRERM